MTQEMLLDVVLSVFRKAHGSVPVYEIISLVNGIPESIRRVNPNLPPPESVFWKRGVQKTIHDFCDRLINKPIKPIVPNK